MIAVSITIQSYKKGILLKTFSNAWTVDDLIASREDELRHLAMHPGIVDVIADMRDVKRFPFNIAQATYEFIQMDWSDFGIWVVITRNGLVRRFTMQVIQKTSLCNRVYFVNSLEDALDVISRKQAERQPTN